ncbi:MAG: hypothetical protein KDB90_00845 [Planctomycetes bacterium]|nr:hypothetical protein [Planctomycetota bacterium]
MSDQATYVADLLLEDTLDEIFHGGPNPELAERILRAANGVEETAAEAAPAQEAAPVPAPVAAKTPLRLLPGGLRARPWLKYALEGVVAAGIAALLILIVMPGTDTVPNPSTPSSVALPDSVAATNDAQYTSAALGGGLAELQVERGWYVLTDGAPTVVDDGHRVEDVEGKVLVKVGEVPTQAELTAMMPWLSTHQIEEKDMSAKQWIKVGALAVCVMAGSAFVDNQYVSAQDSDRKVKESDRPAVKLAELEKELDALKAKLERARGLEDGREKRQKIERIENAIEDKEAQIAAAKERIRNAKDGENKDSDRKRESDSKESDRRKDAERKDGERDADAERERKAREDEAARKARKDEAERKDRDAEDRRRKEREESERKAREENDRKKRDAERPRDGRKS